MISYINVVLAFEIISLNLINLLQIYNHIIYNLEMKLDKNNNLTKKCIIFKFYFSNNIIKC